MKSGVHLRENGSHASISEKTAGSRVAAPGRPPGAVTAKRILTVASNFSGKEACRSERARSLLHRRARASCCLD
jgi:hypothetical protein